MDPQRTGEPLDLDRELAAMLAVEPSVEFVARVRMRIAAEPPPSLWRPSWVVAAAACALFGTITMAAMQLNQTSTPSGAFAGISALVPVLVPGPLAAAASGWRRERPSGEMRSAMRSNAEADRIASASLASRDYAAIAAAAATLTSNFAYIESFWISRRVDGGVTLSKRGLEAASDLRAAALDGNPAAIARALAELSAVCSACHMQYREELPDHSYAIKL